MHFAEPVRVPTDNRGSTAVGELVARKQARSSAGRQHAQMPPRADAAVARPRPAPGGRCKQSVSSAHVHGIPAALSIAQIQHGCTAKPPKHRRRSRSRAREWAREPAKSGHVSRLEERIGLNASVEISQGQRSVKRSRHMGTGRHSINASGIWRPRMG